MWGKGLGVTVRMCVCVCVCTREKNDEGCVKDVCTCKRTKTAY